MPLFDATFTPPPAITGLSVSAEAGWVHLEWEASTLAPADFVEYRIYRSSDGVAFKLLATIKDRTTTAYDDYTAPLGVPVGYRVTQVNLDGYESDGSAAEATAQSSGCEWWLVTPGDPSGSFELPNLTAYGGEFPMQQTEHEPMGRPYKLVEQGLLLGEESDLTMHLLPEDASTMDRLRAATTEPGILLKSPYGEVYPIAMGTLRRTRLVGGRQEVRAKVVQIGAG